MSAEDCRDTTEINCQAKNVKVVTEVSWRSNRVGVVQKKDEDGLRKKVSRRSKSSRKGKGERRRSLKGQTRAESRARHLLSAVGATGVPVARVSIATANAGFKIDHWKCGCRPERIGQCRSCYDRGEDQDSGPRCTSREAVTVRRSL